MWIDADFSSARRRNQIAIALSAILLFQPQHVLANDASARPEAPDRALVFTEMVLKPGENGSRTLRLVRANFHDGKLTQREDLLTGDASQFGYQRQNYLIDNRYVVLTASATVFDLTERKVVNALDGGYLLTVEGPRVYFCSIAQGGERGVFCFDTTIQKRERVADNGEGRWGLRGVISPSGTKAIVRQMQNVSWRMGDEMPYGIALDRVGKPSESLGEFASICGTTGGGTIPDPPGIWLDDDRFLTQTTLGKVVIVNTTDKSREEAVDIPPTYKPGENAWNNGGGAIGFTPLGLQQPRFSLLDDGRVMYEADLVYFIDLKKKTWEKADWRPLGHAFDYQSRINKATQSDPSTKTVTTWLRHDGKAIGTTEGIWWFYAMGSHVVTTDGYVAVMERIPQPGKRIPTDAARVWSAATGEWQTINGWLDGLIGWVK